MRILSILIIIILLSACSGETQEYDYRDCVQEIVPASMLEADGRPTNWLSLTPADGRYFRMGSTLAITGTITISTCKAYFKDTTLYAGTETMIDSTTITLVGEP